MCFFHTLALADGAPGGSAPATPGGPGARPATGLDLSLRDPQVRPQDDLYAYTSGRWLRDTELPADRARYGAFDQLRDQSELQVRAIIEDLAARQAPAGSNARKVGDLYRSFMDETTIEALGTKPLQPLFARIDALQDRADLPALLGELLALDIPQPVGFYVAQDDRDSTTYRVQLTQNGLGLPDRDYYLKDDDARLKQVLKDYQAHIAAVFRHLGEADPDAQAERVVNFETVLAKYQLSRAELRDPVARYHRMTLAEADALAPRMGLAAILKAAGVPLQRDDALLVVTPEFFSGVGQAWPHLPLDTLRSYLKWQVARTLMPLLDRASVDLSFSFYGKTLRGIPENRPRWKRGVELVEHSLGEAVGEEYVHRHFSPVAKARMDALVGQLLAAYRERIDHLDWLGPDTRKAAQEKLAQYTVKIGYPTRWRDYSGLEVVAGDLVGNRNRSVRFENAYDLAKLGHPVDREEWHMTPQTVNAYYNPSLNEIVFPAAILQPPFFNADADDAVNYGAIGAVIGHEISHGFDDQGAQYDGQGNLRDWWTAQDHATFAARTGKLVAQYERYAPVPGYPVNGRLTLGENIADNSGLSIAYKAYHRSLGGKPAPVLEGLTGDQRLYMGWATVWRAKVRDSESIRLVKVDPHAPAAVRGNGTLVNQAGFYEAFGVKPGDKLYVAPEDRVDLW